MKLELNGAGRIVIRNITPDAFGYLEGVRQKVYDPHGYWYFGCRIFGDSLYVDDCIGSAEVKRHHIDVLVKDYGMKIDDSMKVVLNGWRAYEELSNAYDERCEKIKALNDGIVAMQRVLRDGCKGCEKFEKVRDGDDLTGYCVQGETRTPLDESPLSFRYGEYGNDGVHYMGQKFYPHGGCKFLQGERVWKA